MFLGGEDEHGVGDGSEINGKDGHREEIRVINYPSVPLDIAASINISNDEPFEKAITVALLSA